MKKEYKFRCPICEEYYTEDNIRTKHHIFPKKWYDINVTVFVCKECHEQGFNKLNPMHNHIWTKAECLNRWFTFCKCKGKNALKIYPHLRGIIYNCPKC